MPPTRATSLRADVGHLLRQKGMNILKRPVVTSHVLAYRSPKVSHPRDARTLSSPPAERKAAVFSVADDILAG